MCESWGLKPSLVPHMQLLRITFSTFEAILLTAIFRFLSYYDYAQSKYLLFACSFAGTEHRVGRPKLNYLMRMTIRAAPLHLCCLVISLPNEYIND